MNDFIWIGLLVFMIIYTFYGLMGMNSPKMDQYTQWCYNTLLESNFDPPEIHVRKAEKQSCIKIRNGVAYIYLLDQGSDEKNKIALIHLMAYTTSDKYKDDAQYYTNLDVLMQAVEEKEGLSRLSC